MPESKRYKDPAFQNSLAWAKLDAIRREEKRKKLHKVRQKCDSMIVGVERMFEHLVMGS